MMGLLWVCLLMQWAGNAGNECRLSGGLNSYRTIWVTDKIRNRYVQYYLQASILSKEYVTVGWGVYARMGSISRNTFLKYGQSPYTENFIDL